MPILKDLRKTIEVDLPITKGKVWIYDTMLAADALEIEKIYVSETSVSASDAETEGRKISIRASKYYEAMDVTLKIMIAKWDFTNEDGSPVEVTPDNVKKLPKSDYDYLNKKINEVTEASQMPQAVKKN